jgi:hypothetical protein
MKTKEKEKVVGPTEGPWYVGCQNDGQFIINRPPRPSGTDVIWEGRKDVEVVGKVYDLDDFEETAANARLLAAAPTLYKAAKLTLMRLKEKGKEFEPGLQHALEHAIMKADKGWNHGD